LNNIQSEPVKQYRKMIREHRDKTKCSLHKATIAVNNSEQGKALLSQMKQPASAVSNQAVRLPSALVQKLQRSLSIYSTTTSAENLKELIGLMTEALKAAGG
jgi:Tfp pilus assembly PilM family ATPase